MVIRAAWDRENVGSNPTSLTICGLKPRSHPQARLVICPCLIWDRPAGGALISLAAQDAFTTALLVQTIRGAVTFKWAWALAPIVYW